MYYNSNDSLNFNSSIWGADNSFFPRASEKSNKETEDLLADLSYLGNSSSEDITTNELRTENMEQQNTGASENQSHGMRKRWIMMSWPAYSLHEESPSGQKMIN